MRRRATGSGAAPVGDALLEHLETSIGALVTDASVAEGARGFAVLAFAGIVGSPVHATFGLSRHALRSPAGEVTQELLIAVDDDGFAVTALEVLGTHVLDRHVAIAPGERHRLPGWSAESSIDGVLAVEAGIDPFGAADPPVGFVRLLPITASEARFAAHNGSTALAQRLSGQGVDARDLFRRACV